MAVPFGLYLQNWGTLGNEQPYPLQYSPSILIFSLAWCKTRPWANVVIGIMGSCASPELGGPAWLKDLISKPSPREGSGREAWK